MIHPRLSVSALSSFRWSFDEDLALWRDLGIGWAGLIAAKLGGDVESGLARLNDAGIRIATVIAGGFDLRRPASWDAARAALHPLIDAVAAHGGWSVYITPGRTTGAPWRDVLETFAAAVAPSVAHARSQGVRLAIEPSLRTDVSFVNTVRDAIDVCERTGIMAVIDFGNCWMERDFREVVARAAPCTALVQVGDAPIGSAGGPGQPPPGGRVPFGEGDLPVARMLTDVRDSGYAGPIELELPGPLGETEGYAPVIRRGVEKASALLYELGF
ncbi:MAG: sugar phosphate isomerase/epimerase [Novosphingobium sp.]|jgi:sugar phosphate isomerase/epimerase|nr:sugar phosphate isomerase/epimerase [Novosphingobium sp.]